MPIYHKPCALDVIEKVSTSVVDSRLIYRNDKRDRKLEGIMGKELSLTGPADIPSFIT